MDEDFLIGFYVSVIILGMLLFSCSIAWLVLQCIKKLKNLQESQEEHSFQASEKQLLQNNYALERYPYPFQITVIS